jgi:hypothetical protein
VTFDCPRENDVVAAVRDRRWENADEGLKMHAAHCEVCRDVMTVASLISTDQERMRHDVHVPAAGQVWWRAAVRARLEGAHAAARPLTWLHGIAAACAIGLAWAVVGMSWPTVRAGANWIMSQAAGVDTRVVDVAALATAALEKSLPLAFVAAACIVLVPVALYFALSED